MNLQSIACNRNILCGTALSLCPLFSVRCRAMNAWPAKSGQRRERREKLEPLIGIAEGPLVSGASGSILAVSAKISCHQMLFAKSAISRAAAGGRLPTTGEKGAIGRRRPSHQLCNLRNPSRGDGEALDATVGQLFYFRLATCHISHLPSEPGPTTTQYPGLKCAEKLRGLWAFWRFASSFLWSLSITMPMKTMRWGYVSGVHS